MITTAPSTHISVDKSGVAWIDGTKVKVVEVIADHLAYGHSPEEIHLQHPHLSLAQVHAAFAYYFDHQVALDAEIERRRQWAGEMAAQAGESPFVKRLRAMGKLP